MTPTLAIRVLFCALLVTATSLGARADESALTTNEGDVVSIFSGDVHVPAGVRQLGQIVVIGGKAKIEGEAGNVVVIFGELELSGRVEGEVVSVLSDQRLDGADVDGQYVSILGSLEMRESRVEGEFVNVLSSLDRDAASSAPVVNFGTGLMTLVRWFFLLLLFLTFVLLLLLVALAPERVRLIGEEAPARYTSAFFIGLLTYVAVAALWVPVMLSLIGIPLFLLAYLPLKWLGIAGLFYALGRRLGRSMGREFSVLGAVLVVFAIYGSLSLLPTVFGLWGLLLVPLLKFLFFLAVEVPALGLVVLTRVGTRRQVDESPMPSVALTDPAVRSPQTWT